MAGPKRRLVILVQYDPEGGLPAYVRIHLERLQPIAARLVLVSNSPLSAGAQRVAESICDRVIVRGNVGWDFAGWRDALAAENMRAWDAVVLINSSVVGPLFPLLPIVEKMEARGHDFWGMVRSRHLGPHLQSYFLAFERNVITSFTWSDFWRGVEDLHDKRKVIRRYEVGLTKTLVREGFSPGSFIESPRGVNAIRLVHLNRFKGMFRIPMNVNFVNTTLALHRELVERGMPYLKASLFWGKDMYRRSPLDRIKSIPKMDYPWEEIGF